MNTNPLFEADPSAPTAWKRDETALIQVRSNEALLMPPTVVVHGRDRFGNLTAGVAATQTTNACCGATPLCFCYLAPLGNIPFDQFNATMRVQATAQDLAMNASTLGDGGLEVTRWRWARITFGVNDLPVAPVLDGAGNLVVGVTLSPAMNLQGQVFSLTPTGGAPWNMNPIFGAVSAALATSADGGVVFVSTRPSAGVQMLYLRASDGIGLNPLGGCAASAADDTIRSAMAVVPNTVAATTVETLFVGHSTLVGTSFKGHRPGDGNNGCEPNTAVDAALNLLPEMTMVRAGAYVVHGNTVGVGSVWHRSLANGVNLNTTPVGVNPRALAVVGAEIYGSGNLQQTDGGLFRFTTGSPIGVTSWPTAAPVGTVGSLVTDLSASYFGASSPPRLYRLPNGFVGTTMALSAATNGVVSGSPAIGEGQRIYAATDGGWVYAFDPSLSQTWAMAPRIIGGQAKGPSFETALTLDCGPRLSDGGVNPGPGTLYALGQGTGAVYAIIVDSRGLDPTAWWPKFQRDTRNTGDSAGSVVQTGTCRP